MTIARLLGCLWRRHGGEVVLFWAISSLVSWIAMSSQLHWVGAHGLMGWRSNGFEWHGLPSQGFAWLEVTIVVWLTARVALSQQGFSTFGGWRARPLPAWVLWLSEILFLGLVFFPVLAVRIRCAIELLAPSPEGWGQLWSGNWSALVICHFGLFVVLKAVGRIPDRMSRVSREQVSWALILVAVVGALSIHRTILRGSIAPEEHRASSGSGFMMIVPADLAVADRGRWLLDGYPSDHATVSSADPAVLRMPLQVGASASGENYRVRVDGVNQDGTETSVRVEITMAVDLKGDLDFKGALMIRYSNGYRATTTWISERESGTFMPYLPIARTMQLGLLHSPLALPENDLSWDELVDGAELFVLAGKRATPSPDRWPPQPEIAARDAMTRDVFELLDRSQWSSNAPPPDGEARDQLFNRYGAEAVGVVLERGPWREEFWHNVILPYLVRFADESHRPRMLEILEVNPLMGDAFVRKGWTGEAMPLLRQHLRDGKKLGGDSLLALTALREEEMGPMLEKQLHRIDGDMDALAEAMRTHPGVDWEGVTREGWKRVKFGYSRHHVRVKWGAELGDKEALRQILVKAMAGNEWEQGILREWIGREDAVGRLREGWERVVFRDGRWMLGGEGD